MARLNLILRGVSALAPPSSKRASRAPVTPNMLEFLHSHLDLQSGLDAAIFAAALTAFWGQCRLGELLGTSRLRHAPNRFPSRSSLDPAFTPLGSRELHLPCTKTSQHNGENVTLLRQSGTIDPISAIENHLRINRGASANDHLFAFRMPDTNPKAQGFRCLTKDVFLARCNNVLASANFPRITGHCFRIGGTTELLLKGLPPDLVCSMGRWSSDAHMRYWRSTRDLAADQAELLHRYPGCHVVQPSAPTRPVARSRTPGFSQGAALLRPRPQQGVAGPPARTSG